MMMMMMMMMAAWWSTDHHTVRPTDQQSVRPTDHQSDRPSVRPSPRPTPATAARATTGTARRSRTMANARAKSIDVENSSDNDDETSDVKETSNVDGKERTMGNENKAAKRESEKLAKKLEKERQKANKAARAIARATSSGGAVEIAIVTPTPVELEPCSGTRDWYPEEYRAQRWVYEKFRACAKKTGFEEYDAPVLERQELYKRKAGEEITGQMYAFKDQEGVEVTLRPEMTPTLARMVLGRASSMMLPLKWFSIPQCWRFETTQRGRKREHYQWNMDIIGCKSVSAETELLFAVCEFFKSVGVTSADVGIKVNSRKVMASVLDSYGITSEKFAPVCVVMDKLDKIGPEAVMEELQTTHGISSEIASKIIACLACKSVDELERLCGDGVDQAGIEELKRLFTLAADYGFGDWLIFDASVVRGLAYYTGIVFEGFDRAGELRAICGGGRYDRLLSLYGSVTEVPACGFGFGDCVLVELLREKGLMPDFPKTVEFVVAAFNEDMQGKAMKTASLIRNGGADVDMLLEPKKKVANTFDYANRVGARYIVFVAPAEWENDTVRVKDLRAEYTESEEEKQLDVKVSDLGRVREILAAHQAAVSAKNALGALAI